MLQIGTLDQLPADLTSVTFSSSPQHPGGLPRQRLAWPPHRPQPWSFYFPSKHVFHQARQSITQARTRFSMKKSSSLHIPSVRAAVCQGLFCSSPSLLNWRGNSPWVRAFITAVILCLPGDQLLGYFPSRAVGSGREGVFPVLWSSCLHTIYCNGILSNVSNRLQVAN